MTPVKIAIVGCGSITGRAHLPAALRSPKVDLVALVDSDAGRIEQLLRRCPCNARAATSLEQVLPGVQGVIIATPNHAHAPLAQIALGAGIPVLVEKPLTTEYEDAAALVELALRKNTFISVGYPTRHRNNVVLFKELLGKNYFGAIRSFHYEFGTRGGWAPMSAYNLDRKASGGGVLVVSGTHFLDRMLYWFGEPEIVRFEDDSYGGVEANAKAALRFGDFEGTLFFSKTVALKNAFRLEAEHYSCVLPESESEAILAYPRDNPGMEMKLFRRPASASSPDGFQVQLEEFADCIVSGGAPTVDGAFGARSVRLFQDLYSRRTQLAEPWMWYARN